MRAMSPSGGLEMARLSGVRSVLGPPTSYQSAISTRHLLMPYPSSWGCLVSRHMVFLLRRLSRFNQRHTGQQKDGRKSMRIIPLFSLLWRVGKHKMLTGGDICGRFQMPSVPAAAVLAAFLPLSDTFMFLV